MMTTLQQLMALLHRQAESRNSILCISMTRICALTVLLLFNSISTAGELEELSVIEADGVYSLRIVYVLDAPKDYVYDVITDYKHGYRINPAITEIEMLLSDRDEVIRVRNHSEHLIGPFRIKIDWVGDIVETRKQFITIKTIPKLSSFESGFSTWEIRHQGARTRVLHESSMKPNFYVPAFIGVNIMLNRMKNDTLASFKRIECHAMITLELDMEHESKLLKKTLKEGKDCIRHLHQVVLVD